MGLYPSWNQNTFSSSHLIFLEFAVGSPKLLIAIRPEMVFKKIGLKNITDNRVEEKDIYLSLS